MTLVPSVPGVLSAEQARATGAYIAGQQRADGAIPWHAGGQFDVWDHVESAMGLTVTGHLDEARAALRWCATHQRQDGSWPANGHLDFADTNQCAYLAVGLWHFHQVTDDVALVRELWPAMERALDHVIRAQRADGAIGWAIGADGRVVTDALVTGCSSILQALECGTLVAELLGHDRPKWRWAGRSLATALRDNPAAFLDKSRYSMDWYYPVLTGALRGYDATRRIEGVWEHFVWPQHGCRCVIDEPWVTAAESAELVAALDALGRESDAMTVFADLQSLRDEESGAYWTGRNIPNDAIWPVELATWTSAAVLLAADALTQTTAGAALWRDAGRMWRVEEQDAAS